ncbi:hypothetical protein ACQKWADRAFT_10104 [Trichoderma austrokoningii]
MAKLFLHLSLFLLLGEDISKLWGLPTLVSSCRYGLHDAEPFLLFNRAAGSITLDTRICVLIMSGLLSLFLVLPWFVFFRASLLFFETLPIYSSTLSPQHGEYGVDTTLVEKKKGSGRSVLFMRFSCFP